MCGRPLIGIPTQSLEAIDGVPEHVPPSWVMSQRYFLTVTQLGAVPWMVPLLDEDPETLREIYDRLDGVFLAGGVDVHPEAYGHMLDPLTGRTDPPRDRVEMRLVRWALEDGMPLLGACRGMQAINVAAGGTLCQDVHERRDGSIKHDYYPIQGYARDHIAHEVGLEAASRLREVFGAEQIGVNSMHHQGVEEVAPGFRVSATAPDGLIEGIELPDARFTVGVQWHPEMLVDLDAGTRRLFGAFLDAAAAYQRAKLVAG